MRVDGTAHIANTFVENVVTAVTTTSIQPIPPEKRGKPTVIAHGNVDTRQTAATVPEAARVARAPALATISTTESTSQLARPGPTDVAQCTSAISVRLLP